MLQPVGSVFLAMWLIDETPSALQLVGVALVLIGVAAVALARRRIEEIPEPAG
jgi:drug/metabolite transporter (DMT)-like permease